jgi:hypothetical protein
MLNYFVRGSVINRLLLHLECVGSGTHFCIMFGNWPDLHTNTNMYFKDCYLHVFDTVT